MSILYYGEVEVNNSLVNVCVYTYEHPNIMKIIIHE